VWKVEGIEGIIECSSLIWQLQETEVWEGETCLCKWQTQAWLWPCISGFHLGKGNGPDLLRTHGMPRFAGRSFSHGITFTAPHLTRESLFPIEKQLIVKDSPNQVLKYGRTRIWTLSTSPGIRAYEEVLWWGGLGSALGTQCLQSALGPWSHLGGRSSSSFGGTSKHLWGFPYIEFLFS
jgi:hypothetical protein